MSEGDIVFTIEKANLPVMTIKLGDTRSIKVRNLAGKTATIDLSGDAVTYSGDLPVDESARLFFDEVASLFSSKEIT